MLDVKRVEARAEGGKILVIAHIVQGVPVPLGFPLARAIELLRLVEAACGEIVGPEKRNREAVSHQVGGLKDEG